MSILPGTLTQWRDRLRKKEITPAELVNLVADAIEADTTTNAYLSFDREAALQAAERVNPESPLAGVPIAVKDNISIEGQPTRCASKLLEPYVAPYDATAIRLLKAAGGIPLGRTNMDEFAMGASGENSAFGLTQNPAAPGHIPGGSSSGSAAAVAAHTAIAALGSDTGGSIRQPAAHCGIVGLKPTYGRVSRFGLVAFASSLDQIGPMTQSVEDAGLLLNAIAGHDPKDSTSFTHEVPDFLAFKGRDIKGMTIGLPVEYFSQGNDPGVLAAAHNMVKELENSGANVVEIRLPHAEAVVAAYYIIACAEASSNLSRFDGVRYGQRAENTTSPAELSIRTREQGFGAEVKRRIILGTYVLSSGYYDAYYTRAQKVRSLVARDFAQAFEKVDLIAGPATPTPAPLIGAAEQDHLQTYLADIYTIPANLAGLPAMTIPGGFTEQEGSTLPVGFQLIAPHFEEQRLIQAGYALGK